MSHHRARRHRLLRAVIAIVISMAAIEAQAQTAPTPPPVSVPPVSLILPNYNSVPVGEVAALEGGAFIARANDTSAGFYNPAGLAHAEQSSISGSAGTYQFGSVSPDALSNTTGSFTQIPAMFGVVVHDVLGRQGWAAGFTITRSAAWDQAVDSEAVTAAAAGATNRLRFSTNASYDTWLGSLGIGYAYTDRLRFGGTLDGQYSAVSRRQSVSAQRVSSAGLAAVAVGALGNMSATHLRATLGAQYRVTPTIQLGAMLRTAGLGVTSSGDVSLEGLAHAGTATAATAMFDPDASVEYRLPFEFKAGGAWIGSRAQLEVDVLSYAGTGRYTAIETAEQVTVALDPGTGGAVTVTQGRYQGAQIDSRTVVNVAVGGRYQLTADRTWTLHGGYATDRSPVGDNDTAFTRVNLQHVTVGLSGRTTMFLGSLGLRYSTGRSGPVGLGPLPDGSTFDTRFRVSSVGLVYSLALLF
jgi:hypothetical protein